MPVFKLKKEGKYWRIRYSEGRRSKHPSTGQTDKALAQKVMDNFVREYHTPKNAAPADASIDVVLRQYKDDKRSELASELTHKLTVDHLIAYYGDKPVSYITASTNKEYEIARRKYGWANATINRHRNALRAALTHAVKEGRLTHAPHIPSLSVPQTVARWLSKEEALRLYRAVRHKKWRYLNLFIRIGLGTGARHEAILSLTWDRVDLNTGHIDFRVPGRSETKKRRPHAPVNKQLLRLLRAAYKVRRGDHVIMHRGGPLRSLRYSFEAACGRAGLKDVTPHTLKHTYITWLLLGKASIWDVSVLTNTSVATIEKHYGHHAQDKLRDVVDGVFGK